MKKETIAEDQEWDRKRILIVLLFLGLLFIAVFELKDLFLNKNPGVLGRSSFDKASVEKPNIKPPDVDLESQVGSAIFDIKKNIGALDAREVASSSPQIQKVLNDIQGIKDLPSSQAKDMCLKLCSGI